ncbi:heavy-metal-associated domain-containing protein [Erysipelothrix urinaevulpis]|uniref:heavy-metal-associated domain-containing protein n=1 Tax=Erysipelothrix urinaevulpis TaxID=2683717 RepID=UPI001356BDB9|nr:cation transporter [Erysipelothrix urinaevulpis]
MKKLTLQLEELVCPTCVQKIEAAVNKQTGVIKDKTTVKFNASKLITEFDASMTTPEKIVDAIENVGFEVKKVNVR